MTGALFQPTCTGAPLGWSMSFWLMLANHVVLIGIGVMFGWPIARYRINHKNRKEVENSAYHTQIQ